MMLNLSIFSQVSSSSTITLNKYPKSLIINKDTVITFRLDQARELAVKVETVDYQDSVIKNMTQTDKLKDRFIVEQSTQIGVLKNKVGNSEKVDSLRVIQLTDSDGVVKKLEKEVKKEKIKRKIAVVGGVTAVILTVLTFYYFK